MLKYDYNIDLYTGETINLEYYANILREEKKRRGVKAGVYKTQAAELYYKTTYNKEYRCVLAEFFDIPVCPIVGEPVGLTLSGVIKFGYFSPTTTPKQRNMWIAANNLSFLEHVKRMKKERCGVGNPFYGAIPWNKGLTRETSNKIKDAFAKRSQTINNFSEEKKANIKQKRSSSAKKRKIHGHTGKPHSEKTKQILREKTLARIKNKTFLQTQSSIHIKVKNLLVNLDIPFEEEFRYGVYSFDFRVNDTLIEVQGDYWHCNPLLEKYKTPKTKGQKINTLRDFVKRRFVVEKGEYKLVELWENEINNNIKNIELCLKKLFK